ncbi:hypothetical protein VTN31DRAFT_6382 [Thermomyces dupontii]|uniref:uncharacterized protein n=1 Tax=Talaromyces thermophilus TaxID=28565 RepID=UPI003743A85C
MGSLIYRLELGVKPKLSMDHCGNLVFPEIQTGHKGLDTAIRKAWLGQYSSTAEMLEDVESFLDAQSESINRSVPDKISKESLRDRVKQWREQREKQFGSVLYGVPTEDQIRKLAGEYGWDVNEGRVFVDYRPPSP